MTFIWQAGILKRVENSSDSKIFNGNIAATSCANMIKLNRVTSEIASVTTALYFGRDGKNWHIPLNISESTGGNFTSFSALVDMYKNYEIYISFTVAQRMLLS